MSTTATSSPPTSEFKHGWKALAGAMALYSASPVIIAQTASLFIEPTMTDTGLSQTDISIGPIIFITLALTQPLVAYVINRRGTRGIGITAVVVMLAGLGALTVLPPSRATFWSVGILMGLGGALGYLATTAQFLAKWFSRHYALTVGIVGSVGGIVPFVFTLVLADVLNADNWRLGYYVIGGFMLLICLPTVLAFFREPAVPVQPLRNDDSPSMEVTPRQLEGVPARQAAKDPRYWLLTIAFLGVSVAVGGILASIAPILISKGFSAEIAARISLAMLAGVMCGRVVGGFLLDRARMPYLVPTALFAISGAAAVAMKSATADTQVTLVLLAIFLIGVSQGAEGDFPAYFFRREFGRKSLATLSSWVYLLTTGFAGIGGFLFAGIRDSTGGYATAINLAIGGFAIGTALTIATAALSWRSERTCQGDPASGAAPLKRG